MKRQVLFVDDEPNILKGLQRMLRPMRNEWNMHFAEGGHQALEIMDTEAFDVVVTDMRMPRMNGAELLSEIMERHPSVVRIVLSGQSDRETILRSVRSAHQFLSKPSNAEMIKSTVSRACNLRDLLRSEQLKKITSQIKSLPSVPVLYTRIYEELKAPDPSMKKIGEIIEQDIGMSAKILQLVNSAFFGLPRHVTSPAMAANLLGLETIKDLVLLVHVFSEFNKSNNKKFIPITELWQHNMETSKVVRKICLEEGLEKESADHAFIAGLLHDSGKLVFAANLPDQYEKVMDLVQAKKCTHNEAENEIFNATHADVGAHLLGLWGLPYPVVEAVAYHHRPSECEHREFSPLAAVHIANGLLHEYYHNGNNPALLDPQYLAAMNLENKLPKWRQLCEQALQELD